MKIEILGVGCSKCKKLEENARKALEDKVMDAEIIKITDINKIVEYGVMSTPGIVIEGVVKKYGRIATVDEIKNWLDEYNKNKNSESYR